jgi:hypothetical protein
MYEITFSPRLKNNSEQQNFYNTSETLVFLNYADSRFILSL